LEYQSMMDALNLLETTVSIDLLLIISIVVKQV
jgi:hypothetical protein